MTINVYDVGDVVRVTITFAVNGTATDPTTVTLSVKEPDGTVTSYSYAGGTVQKSTTGVYYKDLTIDASGTWTYRWVGTGTAATAEENQFLVRTQKVVETTE